MFISKKEYKRLVNLIDYSESIEARLFEASLENNKEFLEFFNKEILPNQVVLKIFNDSDHIISFIVCYKPYYEEFLSSKRREITLFAISSSMRYEIQLDGDRISGRHIPRISIVNKSREKCIFIAEIMSFSYKNRYYGTALIDCTKDIMRILKYDHIKCELGPQDACKSRDDFYKNNGFEIIINHNEMGHAFYNESIMD